MASTFFKDAKASELWIHEGVDKKRFVGFDKTWLKQENRKHCMNIWHVFRDLLKTMSGESKLTNAGYYEYDRMTLAQVTQAS